MLLKNLASHPLRWDNKFSSLEGLATHLRDKLFPTEGGAIAHIYFKDYSKENITTPLPDEQKK
ncbi:hypothetical protein [Bathymodiolus platifrons methanotrophic gill symbiont]|uniref:hypothetical protein n=1 Tax=Bathymodiolus platifrons methanotrophic gill symbiont TaxID=113268 RepID=UPI001FCCCEF5|nr:hypothetical protein [Bathymodiolus platifrons methanotrophic gill symbiont]